MATDQPANAPAQEMASLEQAAIQTICKCPCCRGDLQLKLVKGFFNIVCTWKDCSIGIFFNHTMISSAELKPNCNACYSHGFLCKTVRLYTTAEYSIALGKCFTDTCIACFSSEFFEKTFESRYRPSTNEFRSLSIAVSPEITPTAASSASDHGPGKNFLTVTSEKVSLPNEDEVQYEECNKEILGEIVLSVEKVLLEFERDTKKSRQITDNAISNFEDLCKSPLAEKEVDKKADILVEAFKSLDRIYSVLAPNFSIVSDEIFSRKKI